MGQIGGGQIGGDAPRTGGGGVSSVNGEIGVVLLDAVDVGAEPAGAIAAHVAELDPHPVYTLLIEANARALGAAKVVTLLSDLDLFAPAVAGVRTITPTVLFTTAVTVPADERVEVGSASALLGLISARCSLSGNVDAPFISGPLVTTNMGFTNASVGPSASAMAVSSTVGRVCRIEYCSIQGGARAGTIGPLDNIATFDRLLLNNCAGGFVFTGVIVIAQATRCAAVLPAGSIAWTVPTGVIVARAISWDACSFLTSSSADRGIRVESGVVFVAGTPSIGIQITSSTFAAITGVPGDLGKLWDENAGALSRKDPRVAMKANITEPDSVILGDVDFDAGELAPIVSTYVGPAPTAWLPIAHQNVGPTVVLSLLQVSARFSLFRNGADPNDWYIEYIGPNAATVRVTFTVIAAANSGGVGESIEYRAEVMPAGGAWTPIAGSDRSLVHQNTYQSIFSASTITIVYGDRFRLSRRNASGIADTKIKFYDLVVGG